MSNADLLPFLLFKINQNQHALEAAIMELTLGSSSAAQVRLEAMCAARCKRSARKKSSSKSDSCADGA